MPAATNISLAVIILGAGASSRMGQPKLLLPWGDTTVLGHLIKMWTQLGAAQIAVVSAPTNTVMSTELNRLGVPNDNRIYNPQPERGMFSSVLCAANWTGWQPRLTHWAVVLGDQPHLQAATLSALMKFAGQQPGKICQPSRNGRARHPVLLPQHAVAKLSTSRHQNLKLFLKSMAEEIKLIELDDAGLDVDVDHPEDYEVARKMYFGK